MRLAHSILVTLSLTVGVAGLAFGAPALDSAGKCRDNGKFVDAKLCKTTVAAEHCRDVKTKKFAKCGTPGTEPVPTSK